MWAGQNSFYPMGAAVVPAQDGYSMFDGNVSFNSLGYNMTMDDGGVYGFAPYGSAFGAEPFNSGYGLGQAEGPVFYQKKRKVAADFSVEEAAVCIQKWVRSLLRTRRFMLVVRRGIARKRRLADREKLARRLYKKENEVEELKRFYFDPAGGAKAVNKIILRKKNEAATKIQAVLRGKLVRLRRTDLYKLGKRMSAILLVQRRWRQLKQTKKAGTQQYDRPITLAEMKSRAKEESVFSRPILPDEIKKYEEKILNKIDAYHPTQYAPYAADVEELEAKAQECYLNFVYEAYGRRKQATRLSHACMEMEQMCSIMSGASFDNRRMANCRVASKDFVEKARGKHRQRVRQYHAKREQVFGGSRSMGERSDAKSREDDARLKESMRHFVAVDEEDEDEGGDPLGELERALGYDFRPYEPPGGAIGDLPSLGLLKNQNDNFNDLDPLLSKSIAVS